MSMSEAPYLDGIWMVVISIRVSKMLMQGILQKTEPISSIKNFECLDPSKFSGGAEHAISVIA